MSNSPPLDGSNCDLDTTPNLAKPPQRLIHAAELYFPEILADKSPPEMVASDLAQLIKQQGHTTLAAAMWAIHQAIEAGRLVATRFDSTPRSTRRTSKSIRIQFDPSTKSRRYEKMAWEEQPSVPQQNVVGESDNQSLHYGCFKVIAQGSLWQWWEDLHNAPLAEDQSLDPPGELTADLQESQPSEANSTNQTDGTNRERPGPKTTELEVQQDAELASEWNQARDNGVYKGDFARTHGKTIAEVDQLLDRVRKRKERSDK